MPENLGGFPSAGKTHHLLSDIPTKTWSLVENHLPTANIMLSKRSLETVFLLTHHILDGACEQSPPDGAVCHDANAQLTACGDEVTLQKTRDEKQGWGEKHCKDKRFSNT